MKYIPPINGDQGNPNRPYVNANPGLGIAGSYPDARGLEHPQREILAAIAAAGLVPDEGNLNQLAEAIELIAGRAVPVGTKITIMGSSAPAGFLKINGALLTRAAFPALWAHAEASNMLVTEAAWASNMGSFSSGDLATTFRLPDARGIFERAWDDGRGLDAGRVLGSWQDSANRSHTHSATMVGTNGPDSTGGTEFVGADSNVTNTYPNTSMALNASGGSEARPQNNAWLAVIKY